MTTIHSVFHPLFFSGVTKITLSNSKTSLTVQRPSRGSQDPQKVKAALRQREKRRRIQEDPVRRARAAEKTRERWVKRILVRHSVLHFFLKPHRVDLTSLSKIQNQSLPGTTSRIQAEVSPWEFPCIVPEGPHKQVKAWDDCFKIVSRTYGFLDPFLFSSFPGGYKR